MQGGDHKALAGRPRAEQRGWPGAGAGGQAGEWGLRGLRHRLVGGELRLLGGCGLGGWQSPDCVAPRAEPALFSTMEVFLPPQGPHQIGYKSVKSGAGKRG